ncbi:MAG: His/Gly/Thr/Pro-type tRNA ligase C-terminal domain-containing protein [Candidatus Pacebacteria bacterium]|jgi:prolyl-tRNA synthetase|nr:His/Gly/Thr/Pro-type tRNA ligase C-terminal domain-containing protein [Candidatus Paceibacterota bacterium]
MRQSQLFTKTQKDFPADETSAGTQFLLRAGFIDRTAAGVYTILPLGYNVLRKIENIIAKAMDRLGGQRVTMPALVPKKYWETTGRWNAFDALYKLKGKNDDEYALGATLEEIVTPLAQKYAVSYKDFPFSIYQIQTKFRDEMRAKSGLLRGREFLMKDLYSFHVDQKDCDALYEKVKDSYFSIFKETGLAASTYLTLAGGGTFSKFSHEFQTATEAGEDIIYLCDNCGFSINREIKKEYPKCPECGCEKFGEKKAIEVGNIFKLGTKYSAAFGFEAVGPDGCKMPVLMNCYGIGLTRLMGTVAEISRDSAGLIWPAAIAPFEAHLVELESKDGEVNKKIREAAQKIYSDLQKRDIGVLYDDRTGKSVGEKFKDADLLGMPFRVVVSEKSLAKDSVEIKKRDSREAELVGLDKACAFNFKD